MRFWTFTGAIGSFRRFRRVVKSVQSALSDLKRPPERCFLKQSFAQTCLKETDNGKLQQIIPDH